MEGAKTVMVAVLVAAIFFSTVSARNITVGGSTGWNLSTNFTYWSFSTLIVVNDSLEFIYTEAHDVIEVTEANFMTCDTSSSPIAAYNDISGNTLINLPKPGPRYFVCGRSNHCTQGLKLYVEVLDTLESNTSSPSDPSKPPGAYTSPAAGPDYEHKKHSSNSSAGKKTKDVPLWLRVVLTIICLVIIYRVADGEVARVFLHLYCFITFSYLLSRVVVILKTYFWNNK